MEKGKLYHGRADYQLPATFTIITTKPMEGNNIPCEDDFEDFVFFGESDGASTLFGWGIVMALLGKDKSVMIVFNDKDEVIPPKGVLFK